MRIIPAIDIIDGQCVRLTQGNYETQTIYSSSPLAIAKSFEDNGIQFVHIVDLDGAKNKAPKNLKIVEQIALKTNLQIDFGGGIKSEYAIRSALSAGVKQVNIGSIAIDQPELMCQWLTDFGSDVVLLSADVKGQFIATQGWQNQSNSTIQDCLNTYLNFGLKTAVITDISKDGMLGGPSLKLYQSVLDLYPIQLIASGGIASFQDINNLKAIGCSGAIIGKAIYEGKISLKELGELC